MTKTKTDDALAAVVSDIVKEQDELEKELPLIERKRGRKARRARASVKGTEAEGTNNVVD